MKARSMSCPRAGEQDAAVVLLSVRVVRYGVLRSHVHEQEVVIQEQQLW